MDRTSEILRKIRHLELRTRGLVQSALAGQYHSVFKGRGMNFEEVREYQPGDEIRTIDWNVTARTGRAHIKKFTEERELSVLLMVDASASGNFGSVNLSKRELAAEVACVLAFSAVRNGDKVGLLLFSDHVELYIPPKKGRQHTLRLIREILFFEPEGRGTAPGDALVFLNRVLPRRSLVFLLSDFQFDLDSPAVARPLAITARKHDLVTLPVDDPCEQDLPDAGIVTLEDPETGQQIELNSSHATVRDAFRQLAVRRSARRDRHFRQLGVDSVPLSTGADYLPALRNFFDNRERRLALR